MIKFHKQNVYPLPVVINELNTLKSLNVALQLNYIYRNEKGRFSKSVLSPNRFYQIVQRCGTNCTHCGRQGHHFKHDIDMLRLYTEDGVKLTVEHIKPKDAGGNNEIDNLTIFCEVCNRVKGNYVKQILPHIHMRKFFTDYINHNYRFNDNVKFKIVDNIIKGGQPWLKTSNAIGVINNFNKMFNTNLNFSQIPKSYIH